MKFQSLLMIGFIALANASCTGRTDVGATAPVGKVSATVQPRVENEYNSVPALLAAIDQANDICRGAPGDSMEGKAACEKRARLMLDAEKANWCWGPQDAFGYEQRWIKCTDDPARVIKHQWFAQDINHANCVQSSSPADKMREIQAFGQVPRTNDLAEGTVEVEEDIGNGKSRVWTFYRGKETCEAALPISHAIDKKYE